MISDIARGRQQRQESEGLEPQKLFGVHAKEQNEEDERYNQPTMIFSNAKAATIRKTKRSFHVS